MQVNRRDADYHHQQLDRMTDLDRLAVAILQMAYSGSRSQTHDSQRLIQMDCVAVHRHGNEFVVASNSVGLTSDIVRRAWFTLGGEGNQRYEDHHSQWPDWHACRDEDRELFHPES